MIPLRHESAIVETKSIGPQTRVGPFSHILTGAEIGDACEIGDQTYIASDVRIGNHVSIRGGVQIMDGVTLEDHVAVGPNTTFVRDKYPGDSSGDVRTVIRSRVTIGANVTILRGVTVSQNAVITAGAVVTRDVPPYAIAAGTPARIIGYVDASTTDLARTLTIPQSIGTHPTGIQGVTIYRLPLFEDLRGSLTASEILPFAIKRYFLVFDAPNREVRGEHAHRELHQFLICVHGECRLIVDDGDERAEILLNTPAVGIHINPMVWALQYQYSADAVLMVLASDVYRSEDYIRDYAEFRSLCGRAASKTK